MTMLFPKRAYILIPSYQRDELVPHQVSTPDEVFMSGRFHQVICGDVGFASAGNVRMWWIHTAGPLVDYLHERTGDPSAVVIVGFCGLSIDLNSPQKSVVECKVHVKVELLCILPLYRKHHHGEEFWRSIETSVTRSILQMNNGMESLREKPCETVESVTFSLEATMTINKPDYEKFMEEMPEHEETKTLPDGTSETRVSWPLKLDVMDKYTTGSWKFWRRVGFTAKHIIMGPVWMYKVISTLPDPRSTVNVRDDVIALPDVVIAKKRKTYK